MNRSVLLSLVLGTLVSSLAAADGPPSPVKVIFDTDIEADVDDVGAVAVLHALANRGEAQILAMGVSAKHPWCAPCLDALNTHFGRPDIPIGVLKGPGVENESKYCQKIAAEFPHDLTTAADAPDVIAVYRKTLAAQTDRSTVVVSVGFLTNLANLLKSGPDSHSPLSGVELVRQKVHTWVCMGAHFPRGKEWNIHRDAAASIEAVKNWPTPIVWSGFEIGEPIQTGAGLAALPKSSPVRRAYEHYNGLKHRSSWDQTAVLFAVRGSGGGLKNVWDVSSAGYCQVNQDGSNQWVSASDGRHSYLLRKLPSSDVAKLIEALMVERPTQ